MRSAAIHFEAHKEVNTLYFTSDKLAFFDKDNAAEHAKKLVDKSITTVERPAKETPVDNLTT